LKSTDLFVVSIVPCYAKKLELKQKQLNTNVGYDVDLAITTTELVKILRENNIDLKEVKEENFDDFFGSSSGAGAIFGNTGGVLEAVLRSAGDHVDNEDRKAFEFKLVRGLDGIRRADVKFKNRTIKTAVVTGLRHLDVIFNELKVNPHKYDFIEVMACDGGCIGGPGQPILSTKTREQVLKNRAKSLYKIDKDKACKKAHTNPAIKKVYDEFLGEVGGAKAKKLLHRKY
jgi:iron only hydrogenase large subunit-like protein